MKNAVVSVTGYESLHQADWGFNETISKTRVREVICRGKAEGYDRKPL
jgi:hypothetical protein